MPNQIDPVLLAKMRQGNPNALSDMLHGVGDFFGIKSWNPSYEKDFPINQFQNEGERQAYMNAVKQQATMNQPDDATKAMTDSLTNQGSLDNYKYALASNSGVPSGAVDPNLLNNVDFSQPSAGMPAAKAGRAPAVTSPALSDLSGPSSQYSSPLSGALDIQNLLPNPEDKLAYKRAQVQNMMIGALGDSLANRTSAGAVWRGYQMPQQDVSGFTNKLNEAMTKPDEEKMAEMQATQNSFALKKAGMENEQMRQEQDPNSPLSKSVRGAFQAIGIKVPNTLTAMHLKELSPALAQAATQKFEMQKMGMEYGLKQQLYTQGIQVPGFQPNGSVRPGEDEAKELRKAAGATNNAVDKLTKYQSLLKQYGANAWQNPEVMAAANDLRLTLKDPELYNINRVSDTTLGLIDELVNPPSVLSVKNRLHGTQHFVESAEAVKQNLLSSLKNKATNSGYDFLGGNNQQTQSQRNQQRIADLFQKAGQPATVQR